jgi:hypothetical protein
VAGTAEESGHLGAAVHRAAGAAVPARREARPGAASGPAAKGTAKGTAKGPGKAQAAFQRGVHALAQYIAREGAGKPVPRGHSEQITVDGQAEPVAVKLGVWISNTKTRRDKLTQDQLAALRELGMDWA